MIIMYLIYAFSIVGFFIHFALDKQPRSKFRTVELLLIYQLVFNVGIASTMSFIGLMFLPENVADYLNWNTCAFQTELANASLAISVLGFLSIWFRGYFLIAPVVAASILRGGDGIHHVYDLVVNRNASDGNTGVFLYTDFLIPIILIILLALYFTWRKKKKS